jgi:hypothetical protein
MGDADPALAPKQPPPVRPKPGAAPAAGPQRTAPAQARVLRSAPLASAAESAPERPAPRRWLRGLACAFVLLLAFVAGEFAARYQPDAAVRFQQAASDGQSRIPPSARLPLLLGVPITLFLLLVWQAGKLRKPLFLPFGFFLCLGAASVGMIRGGHDVDMERSAADFQSRVYSLRKELDVWKQAAAKQMSDKDKTMGAALTALELKLEETQADRNKMAGSLQKSSVALQERDEVVSALRKEIEGLKKKLEEKKD